jgi:chemotaxis protein CheX
MITSLLLGIAEAELDTGEMVTDAIGELSNMVVGYVKSRLCDGGWHCVLTIPSVVRGQQLTIECSGTNDRENDRIPQLQIPFAGGSDVKKLHC